MEIIKSGRVSGEVLYGKCHTCGCVVSFMTTEPAVRKYFDRNSVEYFVSCPTNGCSANIYGTSKIPK